MIELTTLLRNKWKEKEILITYYEDGYLLSSYMTVVDIVHKIVLSYVPILFIIDGITIF